MIELGKRQKLHIVKKVEFGVYLSDTEAMKEEQHHTEKRSTDQDETRILLPAKEVPVNAECGDEVEVYVYRDSKDRLIATVRDPQLSVGEMAVLQVKEVGKIGAFLGWSLEKDLLLPFSEQTKRVVPGDECLIALYIDKSHRLCTTMKVYPYLVTDSPYAKEDKVEGRVYEISENFGTFVAVDDKYSALIPKREPTGNLQPGDRIQARVIDILEDGKLTLSLREKAYIQMNTDAEKLLHMLEEAGGRLPFNDKADPGLIRDKTGMSKNEFKRAVGNLYKQRLITIESDSIQQVRNET